MNSRYSILLLGIALLCILGCSGEEELVQEKKERALRIQIDPAGNEVELMAEITRRYSERHGVEVEVVVGPEGSSERLNLYRQLFGARSNSIDIYQLDIIWPGIFARHLEDLGPVLGDDAENFIGETMQASTISGRLVSVPLFINVGVLFYRPSILNKYGYDSPPRTYEELEKMSEKITEGERAAGNDQFWAFAWQGDAYEGLTCNVIEWITSEGGSFINDEGEVIINTDASVRAIERAAKWPGWISSPDVIEWMESHGETAFMKGNAAFKRGWPTARPRIMKSNVANDFEIVALPLGSERAAATLGGWGLGVSAYSPMKDEAKRFVKFMVSPEILKLRAVEGGLIPPRPALYEDPDVLEALPAMTKYTEIFDAAVARPSSETQDRYGEISAALFTEVHAVLTGAKSADIAVAEVHRKAQQYLD